MVIARRLERQAWTHWKLMKRWDLSGQVIQEGGLEHSGQRGEFKQGTEGVHSCVDNGVAVEERKAKLEPEEMA